MKKTSFRVAILFVTFVLLVLAIANVGAITNGEPDGNGHPQVVLILMEVDGAPAFRCSGTMLTAKFVLTAGHCAGAPGEFSGMRIFTESDVDNGDNNYPFGGGPNSIEAKRFAAHPDYPSAPFFVNDVGMIELKGRGLTGVPYATLPEVNSLDELEGQQHYQNVEFTAVGYGLQQVNSAFFTGERVRYVSYPHLIQINTGFTGDRSLLLSNNANTGGTCFGDSGGPNFLGDSNIVAGVTSFGLNGSCGGTGGVFRLDRQDVLDFINDFMAGH